MGNPRNRARKRKRIPPSKQPKKPKLAKHGDPRVHACGPSGAKRGDQSASYNADTENVDVTKEGTIFMDLVLLFTGVHFHVYSMSKLSYSSELLVHAALH